MNRRVILVFGVLAAFATPRTLRAQIQDTSGTVEGVVVDRLTRSAVPSATVDAGSIGALTNTEGRFRLDALAVGSHELRVRAIGYADLIEKNFTVRAGEVTTITLELDRHPNKRRVPFGLGIGISAKRRIASDRSTSDVWDLAFLPRFIRPGLAPALDLPWIDTAGVRSLGAGLPELGVVRIKPTMAGVVWQARPGRSTSTEVQAVAGWSFNSVVPSGKSALTAQVAVPQAIVEVGDSFAWGTRVAVWRELAPRIALLAGGHYLHTRPRFTFVDGTQRGWTADRVTFEAGVAFTLIKAPRAR